MRGPDADDVQTKPNVGHSEPASGLTSLIKIAMALEKGQIPLNINFHSPNPNSTFTCLYSSKIVPFVDL